MALNEFGTGWDDGDPGTYYIQNVATSLNQDGNGYWEYAQYAGGSLANGWFDDGFGTTRYFIGGQEANGVYEGTYYYTGLLGTGVYEGTYYFEGAVGSGVWNDLRYLNGSLFTGGLDGRAYTDGVYTADFIGWDGTTYWLAGERATDLNSEGTGWEVGTQAYYISGVATDLDSDGNGTWNGNTYVGGVVQAVIKNGWVDGIFYTDDVATGVLISSLPTQAQVQSGVTYGNGLTGTLQVGTAKAFNIGPMIGLPAFIQV